MNIGVSSTGMDLEDDVDPRFGRCQYFLIIDTETMEFKSISNMASASSGGAGVQAAQSIVDVGVKAVLTGNIGPNAFRILDAANIAVFTGIRGNIQKAIEDLNNGALNDNKSGVHTVRGHFGMNTKTRFEEEGEDQ